MVVVSKAMIMKEESSVQILTGFLRFRYMFLLHLILRGWILKCSSAMTFLNISKFKKKFLILLSPETFNICHEAIDIHNPVGLKNVSGFLPMEREWMTNFINECELIDSFRFFNNEPDNYTWWSYRQNSRKEIKAGG